MLHALIVSIVESAAILGLVAFLVTALQLSAKWRFHMWATVLLISVAAFGASLVASHRPAPAGHAALRNVYAEVTAVQNATSRPAGQISLPTNAAAEFVGLARDSESIWTWAERIWLLGALLYGARILISVAQTIRLRRAAILAPTLELDSTVSKLLSDLPNGLRVVELETVTSPIFLGFGRPLIVLPKRLFEDLSSDELRFVIAHELQHWRRRDDYVDLVSRIVAALLWPNPSVHLARRFMTIERECACDHAASSVLQSGVDAANSLWKSAQILGFAPRPQAMAALGSSSQLVARIQRLISPRPLRELNSPILIGALIPLVAMATLVATIASPGTALNSQNLRNGGTAMNDSQWAAKKLESGEAARREKRVSDARVDFADAAAWYAAHGPVRMRIHALTRQAQIERDSADYDAAIQFQQTALQLQREMGPDGLPHVVRHFADILDDAGRYGEASPYYAEMETLYRNSSATPPLEMANAVRSLAVHAEHAGDKRRAQQLWTEARDRYSKLDELFVHMTGEQRNPGVEEAERRLALL